MKLLDLDRVFDNDRIPMRKCQCAPDLRLEDLPEDWHKEYVERAAILEYDYGATREYAEAYALRETLKAMQVAGDL